jgi:murein DD-endopeptidase MepM/ murein hydrolase activator NlpD
MVSAAFYVGLFSDDVPARSRDLATSADGSFSGVAHPLPTIPVTPPAASVRTGPISYGQNEQAQLARLITTAQQSAKPRATPSPVTHESECDSSQNALFCVYQVRPGDTPAKIADMLGYKDSGGIKAYEFLVHSNEPEISSGNDTLPAGQKIRIPRGADRVLHTVLANETLSEIASLYGSSVDDIASIAENDITDHDSLAIGKELLIPNPQRLSQPASTATAASPVATRPATATATVPPGTTVATAPPGSTTVPTPVPSDTPPPVGSGFIWPVAGPISSYFGPSHPLGIDIDLHNNPTASIDAAKAGVVTFAGGNACCNYGYYVVVEHGDGDQTLYAHLSFIAVSIGQSVVQGQKLGHGGRSGYATSNYLHFEVRRNGTVINPLSVLR